MLLTLTGHFTDNKFIPDEPVKIPEDRKAIVMFPENDSGSIPLESSRSAFKRLEKYFSRLPADFDYKKELAEARDEKYDRLN
ncbi:MAG: hypothetical protein LBQ88_06700 [Treponema sp.]|jgi:hypothetical protein|nr:hypothetical protein [Treponema sp.]